MEQIDFVNKHTLLHGDCLDRMSEIKDGSVDMIMTDPPYGTTDCKWDSVIDLDEMWVHLKRVIKKNGAIVIMGSEPFSSRLRISNIKNYKYDIYWKKEKPTNFMQLKRRVGKVTENICIFYSSQPTYNPQKYKANRFVKNKPKGAFNSIVSANTKSKLRVTPYIDDGTRYPIDVISFNRVPLGKYIHLTQKPVKLMEYLIKTYTNEGETVLDFAMGSGTTGVACKNLKRDFIGIELDKEYFDMASKRINETEKDIKKRFF